MPSFQFNENCVYEKPKVIVISAVNLTEGGGLTVLKDCLASAAKLTTSNFKVLALVHDISLIQQQEVELIAFPSSKRSWLRHLYHEWFVFNRMSKKIETDLWLSLHDITPVVSARRQAVYCHNPAPFYSMRWREIMLSPTFWIFTLVYKYLYRVFIRRNTYVIVQQEWLRCAFKRMFGNLPLVVAYPNVSFNAKSGVETSHKIIFLYPVVPRFFKNFEVICDATAILIARNISKFELHMTFDGNENAYSKWLVAKYKYLENIKFIGLQSKNNLAVRYQQASAVVFASKLETWGLPISEAKALNKPLLLADLPYARETVGNYDNVSFFPTNDASALADLMQAVIEGKWHPTGSKHDEPSQPFVRNWDELWGMLIKDL